MAKPMIECVPNFSEGQNEQVVGKIAEAISSVSGVRLLSCESGYDTNRTVMTFVGDPEAVVEAAFRGVATAQKLINMAEHQGTHPRIGATDVLPLIPISGVTMEQCRQMARSLAQRIADELGIPTYCYQEAAFTPQRCNLALCRKGEYEALAERLLNPEQTPDFGSRPFDDIISKSGATCVGARDFLIAVNFNLETKSKELASKIAGRVRESGYITSIDGKAQRVAGALKGCKAIGWYIEEFGFAQVSMNITNISLSPLHVAFEQVSRVARELGTRVTGTEIIGLLPEWVLLDAANHFATQEQDELTAEQLYTIAIERMGLDSLHSFDPLKKLIFLPR